MGIPTLYVKCKNKKLANTILAEGGKLEAVEHSPWSTTHHTLPHPEMDGAVIKFFTKYVGGNPYTTSYGNWDAKKQRIK